MALDLSQRAGDAPFELRVRFLGEEKQFSVSGGKQEFEAVSDQ
jgi:hypothetical protein